MRYRIRIVADADQELRRLPVFYRRQVAEAVDDFLGTEPTRESASRIKRLRQPAASVYRLRVGDYRVFYDVIGNEVTVLHVRHKSESASLYGG
ncbi:MAG: type II toxin-antitoxin system RelE/ParE family toxin [Kiritimatiellaeota bacterium]|nr:type II toxin-antitoxin system RelE/ParE family toxin [Kiritimatiellota bacterium]